MDSMAGGRKKPFAAVRAMIDQGPFMAKEALANGLVDAFGYEEQAGDDMKNRLKQSELKKVSAKAYLKSPASAGGVTRRIALVVGDGAITRGRGGRSGDDGSNASA